MYDSYKLTLKRIQSKYDPFKRDPQYRGVLEHVSVAQSIEYLDLLRNEFRMQDETILKFCTFLDSFGSPILETVGNLSQSISPSGLRYLYHAHLILTQVNEPCHFVEVGCGYGGLFLAIQFLQDSIIAS